MPRDCASNGFTILEILVALVILIGGILALTATFTQSLDRYWRSDGDLAATDLAENLLAEIAADPNWGTTTKSGEQHGIEWSAAMQPETPIGGPKLPLRLIRVTLALHWRSHGILRTATWQTLRPDIAQRQHP